MPHPQPSRLLPLLLACALLGPAACSDDGAPRGDDGAVSEEEDNETTPGESGSKAAVTVGSGDSASTSLVGALYAEVLEHADYRVTRRLQYGTRPAYLEALEEGGLDVVPDLVGELAVFLGAAVGAGTGPAEARAAVDDALPEGLVTLEPSQAASTSVLVVTGEDRTEGMGSVSDLAGMEGGAEVGGRRSLDGLDVPGARLRPLDGGGPLTKEALTQGTIDVAVLASTDGAIGVNGWVVLEGAPPLEPPGNVLAVGRADALDDEARALLAEVHAVLTPEDFIALNKRVGIGQEDPEEVARDYAADRGLLGDS
ncbi:ABC transporter substrate-binding protein [soil metagenome]